MTSALLEDREVDRRSRRALDLGEGPFGDYDTVAGLVLDRMGTIPRAGDTCRWEECSLEVLDMDGNRIDKILVTKVPKPKGD